MKIWKLNFSGRVQGVCFRYNINLFFAENYPNCPGYVKNLPDGSVEVLVKANDKIIDHLIEFSRTSIVHARVERVKKEEIINCANLPNRFTISY